MKASITWMAKNHVAANLLMMVCIIGGLAIGAGVKQEVFPEITLDMVNITVPYPGAGPEEIEESIVLVVEEKLSGITGIKEITATASEGMGVVIAELLDGEDVNSVLQEIKSEVDRITSFPLDAEEPIVTKLTNKREVISVVLYGDASERSLKEQAETVRDELLSMPGITQVELRGVRQYEISIEVSEHNLRKYGLTLGRIADIIRKASVDLPGGTIKTRGSEILLRTKERMYTGREYENVTIIENPDGSEVKLKDIATIKDSFEEKDLYARLDGAPASMVEVFRVGEQKPNEISKIVREYVENKRLELPDSIEIDIWNDWSEIYRGRQHLLLKNASIGLFLVFLIMGLFLQVRLAFWVMLGIPISFLGALLVMPALGVSINMISLFAFILALGIVVDDAIIVGENIYEHRRMGKSYQQASIQGVLEVTKPVMFSVLTTMAAFSPLMFISGRMGKFINVIPYIVIPVLVFSLIESLYILPSHLSLGKELKERTGVLGFFRRIREGFARFLDSFIAGPYTRLLDLALRFRYHTVAIAIAILLVTIGLVGGGITKFRFLPNVESDVILTSLQMPVGTPVTKTGKAQELIVQKGQEVVAEIDAQMGNGKTVLRHIFSLVGSTLKGGPHSAGPSAGGNVTGVAMFLQPSEKRSITSSEIARRWREKVGEIPGADSLVFRTGIVDFGANIDVRLAHQDFTILSQASDRLKLSLADYPGVEDIADTYSSGKREMKLSLTPEARTLGITEEDLGRQVRAAFYGVEALKIQRGRNEVKVMVRYPEKYRKSLDDLNNMRIHTPRGAEVPITTAADIVEGYGPNTINRTDRKRVINVTANVLSTVANAEEIVNDMRETVLPDLMRDYPGLTYDLEGEDKERRESMKSMLQGFTLALFIIYALLAIPFKSYSQPMIIMSAIPFGVVGAVFGHLIMGYDISMLSLFGIVALSGVVVNDSLLLIEYTNRKLVTGVGLFSAVVQAAQRRFRPILLTSLTTFFGLMPMIFEKSVQAKFLIPMAISLGFGILFATGITLLLIPSLYLILEDIRSLFGLKPVHMPESQQPT